nr:hypothetical protein [Tanacetum cinerariifolium]
MVFILLLWNRPLAILKLWKQKVARHQVKRQNRKKKIAWMLNKEAATHSVFFGYGLQPVCATHVSRAFLSPHQGLASPTNTNVVEGK